MRRFSHRASATILGAILAVGIPTGVALAASENARHGIEVSALAKTNISGTGGHGAVVSEVAKNKTTLNEPQGAAPDAAPNTHPANHGADVSAVAKDKTLVGDKHNNHGGAVSTAAHKP
jgi:hypothetical protein